MKVTVTDANIFIDLIKLQMLGYLFNIGIEVHTTREIVDQLNDEQFEKVDYFLQAYLLNVHDLSSKELTEVLEMPAPKALDFPDKTVIFLAQKLKALVLTGDAPLRKFCAKNDLDVKGILWLFDVFLQHELINFQTAVTQMKFLLSFNDRLPKEECVNRIKMWEEKI